MESPQAESPRSPRNSRRGLIIGVGCFFLAVAATVPWYELPDAQRFRLLIEVHTTKANECRRLEKLARSAGRGEEAQSMLRAARNFDWFAEAYRRELANSQLTFIQYLVRSSQDSP